MRILCLEDDPAAAELVAAQLAESIQPCTLRRVETREEFRHALEVEAGYDLILADYSLPSFDGLSALRIAREIAPDLPFIFVSGSLGEETAIESLRNGATDYLVKGNLTRLTSAVERAVREAQQHRERREAERKIAEQARLLDLASDAIVVCDLNCLITFWNQGAEQMFGWTAADSTGKQLDVLLKMDHLVCAESRLALEVHGKWVGEVRCRNRSGDDLTISHRMTLVRDSGGAAQSILTIGSDITEKKSLEAQFLRAQRLEGVGLLASGIAHDLNNILAPILMAAPLLKTEVFSPENLDLLATIETSAQRGAAMVKQILSFTRGAEGGQATMDLRLLLNEIARLARDTFPRAISVQTQLPPAIWPVCGDTTQLHQVLLNLCINARDAMPRGGVLTIAVENASLRPEEAGVEGTGETLPYVRVTIGDTGEGIPEALQERIFEPFFTTKEIGKGTGLGLASVKNILTAHGGFLRLHSRLGLGTSFDLFLPGVAGTAPVSSAGQAPAAPRGNGELILVVDDEPQIREVSRRILELNGYRVETAGDGVEAIAAFARQRDHIRVLITDTDMPKMDGKALIRVLLRMRPDLGVVASGGKLSTEEREAFRKLSVHQFLDKPYQPHRLLTVAHDAIYPPVESLST